MDPRDFIFVAAQPFWGPILKALKDKPFGMLTIYSCNTGADQEGADLLYNMAVVLNRPVRARTGFMSCGGGGLHFLGGTWQVSTPSMKPKPIPKDQTGGAIVQDSIKKELTFRSLGVELPFASVTAIELERKDGSRVVVDSHDAVDVAKALLAGEEVDLGGQLLAMLTAKMIVHYEVANRIQSIKLQIFNDSVLVLEGTTFGRFVSEELLRNQFNR
jgi:hypothetical protein